MKKEFKVIADLLPKNVRVLDVGCGDGSLMSHLIEKKNILSEKLNEFEKKNKLLSTNLSLDYVDTLYREKLKFGKKEEIIIKLK